MRTFIAVELNPQIKKSLGKLQDELKQVRSDVKWISQENSHLTLKFLGEVNEEKIPKIIQALKEVANQFNPFEIALANLGAFPNMRFPRVVWVGLKKGEPELKKIADTLEDFLVKLKFPREKRGLSAHLTLGRLRSPKFKDELCQKMSSIATFELKQDIKSITLFKSTLSSSGPIYEKLAEVNLKTN